MRHEIGFTLDKETTGRAVKLSSQYQAGALNQGLVLEGGSCRPFIPFRSFDSVSSVQQARAETALMQVVLLLEGKKEVCGTLNALHLWQDGTLHWSVHCNEMLSWLRLQAASIVEGLRAGRREDRGGNLGIVLQAFDPKMYGEFQDYFSGCVCIQAWRATSLMLAETDRLGFLRRTVLELPI